MGYENDSNTNRNWCAWDSHKELVQGLEDLEIKR